MSEHSADEAIVTLLDAVTSIQGQLEELGESNKRIEANQAEIMTRLDALSASGAGGSDTSEIVAHLAEGRIATRSELARIAQVAGLTHAAVMGNGAPLPTDLADDELLELYVLTQPADRSSTDRALVEWRRLSKEVGSAELVKELTRQYQPSPTDTLETRLLRYRLAAISREELEGRGVKPAPPPTSTKAQNRSVNATQSKSDELARLWRGGESIALFAEPELAGALDLFEAADRRSCGGPEERLSTELAELHRELGDRLAGGQRPTAADQRAGDCETSPGRPEPDRAR